MLEKDITKVKNQSFRDIVESTGYTLNLIWKNSKSYMFLRGGMILFNSVIPLASTLLPGLIINELISEQRINIICLYVGILVLSSVFQYIRPVNIQADL